jgi:outer membrane protein OmpA-like peptidoglycan-associated protein
MDDSTSDRDPKESPVNKSPTGDSLDELRKLLLKPVQSQIDDLRRRLDTPELHAKEISRVLPEAIALRSSRDKKLEISLEPITENAIRTSIKKDRKVLVDALFPLMGPAIRKAITSVIQGMIQTFNQLLEHSLSLRSLKWRLEALRTRKPFAEVVLLNTMIYHVEQVFLIHKETGLVLRHEIAKSVVAQDPDIVSGMLTAIKDFVQDSFGAEEGEDLETLRLGERSIWIEQGQHALVAAVVHGNPPLDFQTTLREAIEEIHFTKRTELENFSGDDSVFEDIGYILSDCLKFQLKQEKKKTSFWLWIILAAVILAIGAGIYILYEKHRLWTDYVDRLMNEPGIVVSAIEKRDGKHHVFGLRDPLSTDPQQILQTSNLDPDKVVYHWEPYFSSHPQYALKRINKIITPPSSVTLELNQEGILNARGSALHKWLSDTRKMVNAIPWIVGYRDDKVTDIEQHMQPPQSVTLEIKENQLHASGSAGHQWIAEARQKVKSLEGISALREDNLIDTDVASFDKIRMEIQNSIIYFKHSSDVIVDNQQVAIQKLVRNIKKLNDLVELLNKNVYIEIVGHSDTTGSESIQMEISWQRSQKMLAMLVADGIPAELFRTKGVGTQNPAKEELNESDRAFNRRVSFRVLPTNL